MQITVQVTPPEVIGGSSLPREPQQMTLNTKPVILHSY